MNAWPPGTGDVSGYCRAYLEEVSRSSLLMVVVVGWLGLRQDPAVHPRLAMKLQSSFLLGAGIIGQHFSFLCSKCGAIQSRVLMMLCTLLHSGSAILCPVCPCSVSLSSVRDLGAILTFQFNHHQWPWPCSHVPCFTKNSNCSDLLLAMLFISSWAQFTKLTLS